MTSDLLTPLVQFWKLPDGTRCVVYKEPHTWSVRIERGDALVRQMPAANPSQVLQLASAWRREFEGLSGEGA